MYSGYVNRYVFMHKITQLVPPQMPNCKSCKGGPCQEERKKLHQTATLVSNNTNIDHDEERSTSQPGNGAILFPYCLARAIHFSIQGIFPTCSDENLEAQLLISMNVLSHVLRCYNIQYHEASVATPCHSTKGYGSARL